MSKPSSGDGYVTTRELAAELRSMRWEFRFLILAQFLTLLGIGYKADLPGVQAAASVLPFL
jgi:hypothetical protein